MSDKTDMTPELTLDPRSGAAAAAAQAPAAPEAPTLTLECQHHPGGRGGRPGGPGRSARSSWMRASSPRRSARWSTSSPRRSTSPDSNVVLQYGAGGAEEHRLLFGKRPEQRAHQGPGRGRPGPVRPGGGAQNLRPGGEKRPLRLLPEEEKRGHGAHEGQLRQGRGQRGQDRRRAGGAPGDPDEGHRHAGPDVRSRTPNTTRS